MRQQMIAIALFCFVAVPAYSETDESKEPPLELTLVVNGEPVLVNFDQETILKGEFKNPKIVVQAASARRFDYGGISFNYPAKFTWEAEIEGAEYRCWTLSGNDSKIMYFVVDSEFTPELFARGMVDQFGVDNATIAPTTRTFGKIKLKGKRITIKIADSEIIQDALAIPGLADQNRLLVLQDVVPELTPNLAEPKRVLDLLSISLMMKE